MICALVILLPVLSHASYASSERNPIPASVNLRRNGDEAYTGHIKFGDSHFDLHLKRPETPTLSPDFKLLTPTDNTSDFQDLSPSSQERYDIESRIFVDSDAGAAFQVHDLGKREIRLEGIMNGVRIGHDGKNHFAHALKEDNVGIPRSVGRDHSIPARGENPPLGENKRSKRSITYASPEVLLVLDNKQWKSLGEDRTKALHYLGVLIHAVNTQFSTSKDPVIKFQLVSAVFVRNLGQQSFLEESKVHDGSGGYDIEQTLKKFNSWLYKYKASFAAFDVASLVTGAGMKMKNDKGEYGSNVRGMAYVGGACSWADRGKTSYVGSISEDEGAHWRAVHTLGHELAHSLGAPHDGEGDAAPCPWSEGYIMSYERWGEGNKFHFSPCSKRLMKDFINSNAGVCLRKQSSKAYEPTKVHVGELLSLNEQCVKYLGRSDAYVDPRKTPDQLCKRLSCTYRSACSNPAQRGCTMTVTLSNYPGNKTPCDNKGRKCWHGSCVKL